MIKKKKIEFNHIKHYHFPYTIDVKKRVEIYNLADIFVSTSIEDSGPTTITEAMLCGKPVVAFDTGDATEYVINCYNGYKVKLKDINDLKNKIIKIFSLDFSELQVLSNNARIYALNNLNKKKQLEIINEIIFNKNL